MNTVFIFMAGAQFTLFAVSLQNGKTEYIHGLLSVAMIVGSLFTKDSK